MYQQKIQAYIKKDFELLTIWIYKQNIGYFYVFYYDFEFIILSLSKLYYSERTLLSLLL
jgi:hypothetical protein